MTSQNAVYSKDRLVSAHVSWDCKSSERNLGDVLYPVTASSVASLTQVYTENSGEIDLVYLEQGTEASPCLLRIHCAPHSSVLISSLLIVTEARTMEVYSGAGDYCGTCRGEQLCSLSAEGDADGVSLFKKYLKLESPLESCDVKLLSLGGRAQVGVGGIVLGLQDDGTSAGALGAAPGIDLHRVQSMVESMGTALSPGAQNLMDMVQFQQKNKADTLSGFLPLLLGSRPLAAMTKGCAEPRRAHATPPDQPPQPDSAAAAVRARPQPPGAEDHTLTDAVSSLLNGRPGRRSVDLGPDLLPVLQGVCGQVTQLRLEDASSKTAASPGTGEEHSCCRSLELRVERRMEEMEDRLKQHIDQRLDALQQRLEHALLAALPLARVSQGIKGAHTPDWRGANGLLNGDA